MSEDVKTAVETSAAAPKQYDGWDENGTPIVTQKVQTEKAQESSPEKKESEAKAEKSAATETAPKQEKKERKPGEKVSAEERISQLTAKNREMEQELSALRERSRTPEPKSDAKQPEPAKQPEAPKRPNLFTWKGTVEEYEAAMDAWESHKAQQAIAEFQRNEAAKAQNQKLQSQLDEAKAKYPDAETKIKEAMQNLGSTKLPSVILAMFNDSECLPELMYVLSDEKTRSNFIETAAKNPGKAIRALAQMEADIRAKQSEPAKVEQKAKSEPEPPAEQKPRAPKPPSEVGGRGAAMEDELKSAAEAGAFSRFEAEMNRRKFAKAS